MRPLATRASPVCAVLGAFCVLYGATGCNTHQCDSEVVCIDSQGLMKTGLSRAEDCPKAGGTPITGDAGPYNLHVSTNLSATGYEVVWETTPIVGPWLEFPGQRTYVIQYPPGLSGHLPTSVEVYVSNDNPAGSDADDGAGSADLPHMNFTTASGSLAELMNTTTTQLSVMNATCAPYSMRLVVRAQVTASDAEPAESGAD